MKKLYTSVFALTSALISFSQSSPTVNGTFLPVNGTTVKEVWDTTTNILPVPTGGANMVWDYSSNFTPSVQYSLATGDPTTGPSYSNTASAKGIATNGAFVRSPLKYSGVDSLYFYYQINYNGMYNVGTVNRKKAFNDAVYNAIRPEMIVPFEINDKSMAIYDTSKFVGTFNYFVSSLGFSVPVKHIHYQYKIMRYLGYGTLKTPAGIYNNTLLTKDSVVQIDTMLINPLGTGYYYDGAHLPATKLSFQRWDFIRNNTFASTVLLFIEDDDYDGKANAAWYTVPVNFGTISGTIHDTTGTETLQAGSEVWLYREHSNFIKNDVLAKTLTDASGNYQFDSIPYGTYLVAVKPDEAAYPNSVTTYFGDISPTSSGTWVDAITINTITCTCNSSGNDIKIKYHDPQISAVTVSGSLDIDHSFPFTNFPTQPSGHHGKNDMSVMGSNAVGGIDIVVRKKPGGALVTTAHTDNSGNFNFGNLNNGNYDVFVDVPGLEMAGTYSFSVAGATSITCLDFNVKPDWIHPTNGLCIPLSVPELGNKVNVSVYPNPYTSTSQVTIQLTEKSAVVMEVYNSLGEKVSTLENSVKQAGSYIYELTSEQTKASGIYFVRLTTNDQYKTFKIVKE